GFGVFLRITCNAEAKLGLARFQQRNEFIRIPQTVVRDREFGGTLGWIAAKGHDVTEAAGVDSIGNLAELVARMADARKVWHHGKAELLLEHRAHLSGPLARRAASTVGDGDEIRLH